MDQDQELNSNVQIFIVDKDLRKIILPDTTTILGVAGDICVNQVVFNIPRIVNGYDLSEFTPYIDYTNANGEGNYSSGVNIVNANDTVSFVWELEPDVTTYSGNVLFAVRLLKVNSSEIVKRFKTQPAKAQVMSGLNVTSQVTQEAQYDILARIEIDATNNIKQRLRAITDQHIDELNTCAENKLSDIESYVDNMSSEFNQNIIDKKKEITDLTEISKKEIEKTKADALNDLSWKEPVDKNTAAIASLKEDLGSLSVGNPITRKKIPKNWTNGYIDTSGNLIANNTGYITQELISFDEDGYTYSLKDTFEGFVSQFKLWVFIYDLSGNYVSGRDESYAVTNIHDAPKPDTQHRYRFMLSTVNWETFSDSNINTDKANTILQIKKEIKNPYAKKTTWKKWNAIGDSITFFDGYEPIVKNALGIESYTNNGQSGFSTPMIGKSYIDSMSDDYDLITFFMGTNNFGRCNSIAETKSSCESIFSAMADKWQTSDIVIILPIQRWGYTGDDVKGQQVTMTNSDGITLRDYCLAIKEIAEKYTFCVLDGYYRSGIIGGENGNTSNYLKDGLHPNDRGNALIANMIVKFLKANF